MQVGGIYKHTNNRDVAIMVTSVFTVHNRLKLKIRWINVVNPKNPFDMGLTEKIEIFKKDLRNWERIDA